MGRKIKRIAKNKTIALFSLGGFVIAVIFRLIFGGSHLNISRLDSRASEVFHGKTNLFVNSARADSPGWWGEGSSCGCGEGGEGSGGGGDGGGGG